MNTGLEGFVLFRSNVDRVTLSLSNSQVRVSCDALRLIGSPSYVNVFFDDVRKRMAIKAADEKTPNAFPINKTGLGSPDALRGHLLEILGTVSLKAGSMIRFPGWKLSNADYVIFDLAQPRKVEGRTIGRRPKDAEES